jgi:methyltransferase (TIGR00027 family)
MTTPPDSGAPIDPARHSLSALAAALFRAVHATADGALLSEPYANGLVSAEERARVLERLVMMLAPELQSSITSLPPASQLAAAVRANPAYGGIVLRQWYAEGRLEAAIKRGATRYVIVGAGMDTFTMRAPAWAAGVEIVEIDHPVTQAMKHERFESAGLAGGLPVQRIPVDLGEQSLLGALTERGLADGSRTFFSCLGLLPYLTLEQARRTLADMARASDRSSEIVFDFVDSGAFDERSADEAAGRMRTERASSGEPWVAGFDRASLPETLARLGWDVHDVLEPGVIADRCREAPRLGLALMPHLHIVHARSRVTASDSKGDERKSKGFGVPLLDWLEAFPDFAYVRRWVHGREGMETPQPRSEAPGRGDKGTFFVGGPYDVRSYVAAVRAALSEDGDPLEELNHAVAALEGTTVNESYTLSEEIPIRRGLFLVEGGEVISSWIPQRGASPRYNVVTRGHVLGEASLSKVLWPVGQDRPLATSRADLRRNELERCRPVPEVKAYALTSARVKLISTGCLDRFLGTLEFSEHAALREVARMTFTLLRSLYMRTFLYDRIVDGFRGMGDFRLFGDDHMRGLLGGLRYLRFDPPKERYDSRLMSDNADREDPQEDPCQEERHDRRLKSQEADRNDRDEDSRQSEETPRGAPPQEPPRICVRIEAKPGPDGPGFAELIHQYNAGVYLVLDGAIEAQARGEGFRNRVASPATRPVLHTGAFGQDTTLEMRPGTAAVQIPMRTVKELLCRNTAFRRNFLERARPGTFSGNLARVADVFSMEWVGLAVAEGFRNEVRLDTMARNLAASMNYQFRDRILVVHVTSRPPKHADPRRFERFDEISIVLPSDGVLYERWQQDRRERCPDRTEYAYHEWRDIGAWLLDHLDLHQIRGRLGEGVENEERKYDYGLLVFEQGGRDHRAYFQSVVSKWIVLTDDPWRLVGDDLQPAPDVSFLPVVLGGERDWRRRMAAEATSSRREEVRGARGQPPAVAYARTHPMRAVRARLDRSDGRDRANPRYLDQRSTERLARALTGRMVGLALGGGGALGYSHLPLIRKLREADIPIDIVSGTSFGAIVGGYYAALGREGLDKLEQRSLRIAFGSLLAFAHPTFLEWFLEGQLGCVQLDELETVFIPFATNAFTMEPVVPVARRLSQAMTASGALPPLVASPAGGDVRYVDGGFIANTPSEALAAAGAGFVVRSDPVSPPTPWQPVFGGDVVRSVLDAVRASLPLPAFFGPAPPADPDPTHAVKLRDKAASDVHEYALNLLRGSASSTRSNALNPVVRVWDVVRGVQQLVSAQTDGSKKSADIQFTPAVGGIERAFGFAWPSRVIDIAEKDLEKTKVVEHTVEAWTRLRKPVHVDRSKLPQVLVDLAKEWEEPRRKDRQIARRSIDEEKGSHHAPPDDGGKID